MPSKIKIERVPPPKELSLMRAPKGDTPVEPLEWATKNIDVLCLPARAGDPQKMKMDTTKICQRRSRDKRAAEETRTSEESVQHVPDIARFDKSGGFDLNDRSFVVANIKIKGHPEYDGWWCMYKRNEPEAGSRQQKLEKNPYFRDDPKANAVGPAYVSRLMGFTPDKWGRLEYAETWLMPEDKVAREIFGILASL